VQCGKGIDFAHLEERIFLIGGTALLFSLLSIPILLAIFRQDAKRPSKKIKLFGIYRSNRFCTDGQTT